MLRAARNLAFEFQVVLPFEPQCPIAQVAFERKIAARKRDIRPGNIALFDQFDLEAFAARSEARLGSRARKKTWTCSAYRTLTTASNEPISTVAMASSSDSRAAPSCRLSPFSRKARRRRPEAAARLDRAAAEENLALPFGHAADDDLRVAVVDGAAGIANMARAVVVVRNSDCDRLSALTAEFHSLAVRHQVTGARGPNRTGMSLRTADFESAASTNSATRAIRKLACSIAALATLLERDASFG